MRLGCNVEAQLEEPPGKPSDCRLAESRSHWSFRITIAEVEIHRSARKHRIAETDIRQAATDYLVAYPIDDDAPARELRLGFDTKGRLLELVVLLLDDDAELVIHAMKARPQYFDLLPEGGNT
jgi:hypothetical protein